MFIERDLFVEYSGGISKAASDHEGGSFADGEIPC
jgi:hypothetical protein